MDRDSLVKFSRAQRKKGTQAERLLWERVRGRRIEGFKIRRQHVFDTYILDFYCPELGLAIELIGEAHLEPAVREKDANRSFILRSKGLIIIEIPNPYVLVDIERVCNQIRTICIDLKREGRHYPLRQSPPSAYP